MNLPTQPYKGARDFYPEDKRLQKYLFSILRKTVESFGYEEYDAPIIELLEIFSAKTGEEIVNNQTYKFTDRGGRSVALRPEMTPSVSRMVAGKRKQLTYPLRWYSIPNLWRYERPQKGRFREHWQLNVDIFGESSIDAEIEMIQIANNIFKSFGAKSDMYEIRLNSRKFSDHYVKEKLKLKTSDAQKLIKLMDKLGKISQSDFDEQALELINKDQLDNLNQLLSAKKTSELTEELRETEAIKELSSLIDVLDKKLGIKNVVFSPGLVRGFDYYTDIVFEVYDTHPDNNRSMMGGGRYDGLVGMFGVEEVPTVGFGLGDATLSNFIELHGLMPELTSETKLAVLTVGDVYSEANEIIEKIRSSGINTAIEFSDRKIAGKIKWALSKSIPYVLVLGSQEIENQTFKLKDLSNGQERQLNLEELIKALVD